MRTRYCSVSTLCVVRSVLLGVCPRRANAVAGVGVGVGVCANAGASVGAGVGSGAGAGVGASALALGLRRRRRLSVESQSSPSRVPVESTVESTVESHYLQCFCSSQLFETEHKDTAFDFQKLAGIAFLI